MLDDAAYNNDATATAGLVSFTGPELTWDGDLDQGQSAVIRFTVTVDNPDTGNKTLADTVTSTTPGSTCPASGPAPAACTATVTVLVPGLTITTTAGSATTTPGSVVQYTITVTDTGQTPYTGATVTDDLANVLNDSAYNGDATATAGAVTYAGHVLTWTGNLDAGRHGHHHVLDHHQQPRQRRQAPGHHGRLDRPGQHLPARQRQPGLHRRSSPT